MKLSSKNSLKIKKFAAIYDSILKGHQPKQFKPFTISLATKLLLHFNCTNNNRILLPKSLQAKALHIAHISHFGIHNTFEFLSVKYFWRGSYTDASNFVQFCLRCISAKHHRIPQASFQNTYLATCPGGFISLDLVGPFPNHMYILTV